MNDEEVENKNKLYLWVLTSLGRCFEFVSRICFDLDNLKDTGESQHTTQWQLSDVVNWWFFIFEVACLWTLTWQQTPIVKTQKPKIYTILPQQQPLFETRGKADKTNWEKRRKPW